MRGIGLLAALWTLVVMVSGQLQSVPPPVVPPAELTEPPTAQPDNGTEEEQNDAFVRLNQVETIEGFLELLQDANGNNISMEALFNEEEGKSEIRGGGRLAIPDSCSPRNTTVQLELQNNQHNSIIFPKCTKIERCGGCVDSSNLRCVPAYTERVSLKVLRATARYPGSRYFQWEGFENILVERHVRCIVRCELNPEKCGPLKVFRQLHCKCECKNNVYRNCSPPKHFSPQSCQCECANANQQCCEGGEQSQCRRVFDHDTCQCVLENRRRWISSGLNYTGDTLETIEAYLNATRDRERDAAQLEEVTASPAPTTTTATPTTTQRADCSTMRCPPTKTPTLNAAGQCVCTIRRRLIQRPIMRPIVRPRPISRGRLPNSRQLPRTRLPMSNRPRAPSRPIRPSRPPVRSRPRSG